MNYPGCCYYSLYRDVPLKLGLNEYSGYVQPQNLDYLGNNFLYFGFLPISIAQSISEQGIRVRTWC